ncbi:hypothetical protein D3C75_1238410 [compost metagenome]
MIRRFCVDTQCSLIGQELIGNGGPTLVYGAAHILEHMKEARIGPKQDPQIRRIGRITGLRAIVQHQGPGVQGIAHDMRADQG